MRLLLKRLLRKTDAEIAAVGAAAERALNASATSVSSLSQSVGIDLSNAQLVLAAVEKAQEMREANPDAGPESVSASGTGHYARLNPHAPFYAGICAAP